MATAEQIREKALKRLGVRGTGQTTQAEIQADVDQAYAEVYAELDAQKAVSWDIEDEVPDEFVQSVVALVAYARLDEYSVPTERYRRIVRDVEGTAASPSALLKIKAFLAEDVTEDDPVLYY